MEQKKDLYSSLEEFEQGIMERREAVERGLKVWVKIKLKRKRKTIKGLLDFKTFVEPEIAFIDYKDVSGIISADNFESAEITQELAAIDREWYGRMYFCGGIDLFFQRED